MRSTGTILEPGLSVGPGKRTVIPEHSGAAIIRPAVAQSRIVTDRMAKVPLPSLSIQTRLMVVPAITLSDLNSKLARVVEEGGWRIQSLANAAPFASQAGQG